MRTNHSTGRRATALGLALVLVSLSAVMYPAVVPHAMHHAHHQKATHATALCSWLCAAGQSAESPLGPVETVMVVAVSADPPVMMSVERTLPLFGSPRAPPVLVA